MTFCKSVFSKNSQYCLKCFKTYFILVPTFPLANFSPSDVVKGWDESKKGKVGATIFYN